MPWLTLLVMLLSYFAQRANGASASKAALTAGLAGAGTYYLTHETDWGRANLGSFDGVGTATGPNVVDKNGNTILDPNGSPLKTIVNGTTDVLKSWGAVGTAGVVATTGAVAGGVFSSANLKWLLLGGLGLFFITQNNRKES